MATINPALVAELAKLLGQPNPELMSGLGGDYVALPSIGLNGTRFKIERPDQDAYQFPNTSINVVMLGAWDGVRKQFYIKKYDPTATEVGAPDCSSDDGVTPLASSRAKQCDTCAACPHNAFGTAIAADGSAGKGKRCVDKKRLILFSPEPAKVSGGQVADHIFHMDVPPASFKPLKTYLQELSKHGIHDPVAVFTTIGFDAKSTFPVLTFSLANVLNVEGVQKLLALRDGDEVKEFKAPFKQPALAAPATTNVVALPVQQAAPATTKPAPAPVAPPIPVTPPAASAAPLPDLLSMGGGGMGIGDISDMSEEALAAQLGI